MKYLCLVYLDEKQLDELPDEDCVEFDSSIRKSGRRKVSEPATLPPTLLADIVSRDADGELIATPSEWDEQDGEAPGHQRPRALSARATVVSSGARPVLSAAVSTFERCMFSMPIRAAYRPVIRAARDGVHTGETE